ncbi:unnamed protein product [Nesidiocoris tenuis]|uniref:Uncharacterized protein n=1 Tax=Nesidiocoris tenuis TaxID=355587 RepID=A0A6H5G3T4_9HEMI|nr:unnamed protein product [Nesidiocoris tenuis]
MTVNENTTLVKCSAKPLWSKWKYWNRPKIDLCTFTYSESLPEQIIKEESVSMGLDPDFYNKRVKRKKAEKAYVPLFDIKPSPPVPKISSTSTEPPIAHYSAVRRDHRAALSYPLFVNVRHSADRPVEH